MEAGMQIGWNKTEDREKIVRAFYEEEDEFWHSKVHENGGDLEENILDTLKEISESSVMYEIKINDELAAFFVKFVDEYNNGAIEAFHVKKIFRTPDFLKEFWAIVKSNFENDFWIGLHEMNVAAIKHFERQGFDLVKIENYRGHRIFLYKVKNKLCQFQPPSH